MDSFSTYEFVVSPSKQAKNRIKKVLAIIGYILFTLLVCAIVMIFFKAAIPALACLPVLIWFLIWLTWRYVNVEYEYSITSGTMTISNVYGNRSRKKIDELKIKSMIWIAPLTESDDKIKEYGPETAINITSNLNKPNVYVALYENGKQKRCILYFEVTNQALKILRFYNTATIVRQIDL